MARFLRIIPVICGLVTFTYGFTGQGELQFISQSQHGRGDSSSTFVRINGENYTPAQARELGYTEVRPGVWKMDEIVFDDLPETRLTQRSTEKFVIIEGQEYTPEEAELMGYKEIRPNVWAKTEQVARRVVFQPITVNGKTYYTAEELVADGFRQVSTNNGVTRWVKPSTVTINGKQYTKEQLIAEGYVLINGQWRLQSAWEAEGWVKQADGSWMFSSSSSGEDELYARTMRAEGMEYLFNEWRSVEDWNRRGYVKVKGGWKVKFLDGLETDIQNQETLVSLKMRDPCDQKVTRKMMERAGFIEAYGQWRLESDWRELGWDAETNTVDTSLVDTSDVADLWSIVPRSRALQTNLNPGRTQYVDLGNGDGPQYLSVEELHDLGYDYLCGEWRHMLDWNSRGYFKGITEEEDLTTKALWWYLSKEGIWTLVNKQGWDSCDVEIRPGVKKTRAELAAQGYHELFGEWKTIAEWKQHGWRKANIDKDSEFYGLWEHVDGPNGNYPGCLMSYYYIMFHGSPIRPDLHLKVVHQGKSLTIPQLYELGYGWMFGTIKELSYFTNLNFTYRDGIWWHFVNDRWQIVFSAPTTFYEKYYTLFGESRTMEYWESAGYKLIDGVWYITLEDGSRRAVDITTTTVTIGGIEWTRQALIEAGYYEIFGQWRTQEEWRQYGIVVYGWGYWELGVVFNHFIFFLACLIFPFASYIIHFILLMNFFKNFFLMVTRLYRFQTRHN